MTPIRWLGALGGLLLVLGGTPVAAQSSADAFFHDAAQRYVAGDQEAARRAVERGLKVAPSDPRLRALQKKLKQQEKRREGGRSSQKGTQNRQQNQRSRGKSSQEESSRSGKERRPQSNASSNQQSPRPSDAQSAQTGQNAQGGGAQQTRSADRRHVNALSRAQAKRLLRTLENQETKLLREVQARGQTSTTVEKDW
jgi:hypothetical protein